jgi:hypothetical protein
MDDAEQEPRQHQAHGDFGIDAGATIVGTIKVGHFGAKPSEFEDLIDLHQHMVVGDQPPQRPGDEKLRLPARLRPGIAAPRSPFSQVNQRLLASSTAPRCLTLLHDTDKDPADHVFAPALTDARQEGMVRQGPCSASPMNRRIARLTCQAAAAGPARSRAKSPPAPAHGDLGIDPRAAIAGRIRIKIGHFSAKPPQAGDLIDPHQHMATPESNPATTQ